MEDEAVANLREYIRIPSVHPNVDYSKSNKINRNIIIYLQ